MNAGDVLTVSVEIAAAPALVFEYLTDPESAKAWVGDASRFGGSAGDELIVRGRGPAARGRILEVERFSRIRFSWGYEDDSFGVGVGATEVCIELKATSRGTLVTLSHFGLPSGARSGHEMGWTSYLSQLSNRCSEEALRSLAITAINNFVQAWAETDPERRASLLDSCWAEDARFLDGLASLRGRHLLDAWIGNAQQMMSGATMEICGEPDFCQGFVRWNWRAVAGGAEVARGSDFGRVLLDGRFEFAVGFWDS